jgi:hypothetical protein
MQKLHVDIWTPNCTAFDLYLINTTPTTVEQKVTLTPTLSGWNSYDIPLTQYNLVALNNISQFKFVGLPDATALVYMDNLYFWKASNAPTLSNFTIPTQYTGTAPFTITPPTSNSNGAFTYSSSNPAVATVSGSTITIVGAGSTIITATQAAAGAYSSGTITTTFVVTTAPPPTPAPTPPARNAGDVVSLFSDAYTDVAGTIWFPNWGQSTVVSDITINGNNTKKYESLNYQGVELAGTINVSAMTKMHIDIWTPNCTSFDLYLINISPSTVEEKVTLTPSLRGWNSYDIGMGLFDTVNLRNIAQIKLVALPFGTTTMFIDNFYFWKPGAVVPVTLNNFNAIKSGKTTLINWNTLTESNNKGFAVERSADSKKWSQIQFVNSDGTSTTSKAYNAIDKSPFIGMNYYRLKQVDNDNKFTYSAIKNVNFTANEIADINFYPNPAKSFISLKLNSIQSNVLSVSLIDAQGKVVQTSLFNKSEQGSVKTINLKNISKGIYVLKFTDGAVINTNKIVID